MFAQFVKACDGIWRFLVAQRGEPSRRTHRRFVPLSDPLQNSLRQSQTKALDVDGQSGKISPSDLDRQQIVIHLQPGLDTHKVTLPLN
jgi:hypothetical protein